MFFVPVQVKIHLVQGYRVLFVEEREITTAKAIPNVLNAKERENRVMVCPVAVAVVLDLLEYIISDILLLAKFIQ